jgi:hypothetical protein
LFTPFVNFAVFTNGQLSEGKIIVLRSVFNRIASNSMSKRPPHSLLLGLGLSLVIASTPLRAGGIADGNTPVRPLLDLVLPSFDPAHAGLGELTPADEAQIRNLVTRVHFSIDTRNYPSVSQLFADDGVSVVRTFGATRGVD